MPLLLTKNPGPYDVFVEYDNVYITCTERLCRWRYLWQLPDSQKFLGFEHPTVCHLKKIETSCFEVLHLLWAYPVTIHWNIVELFSGEGQVSAAFKDAGMNVCSYDLKIGGATMDFTSVAGFLLGSQFHT